MRIILLLEKLRIEAYLTNISRFLQLLCFDVEFDTLLSTVNLEVRLVLNHEILSLILRLNVSDLLNFVDKVLIMQPKLSRIQFLFVKDPLNLYPKRFL